MNIRNQDPSGGEPLFSHRSSRVLVVAEFAPGSPGGSWVILKQLLRGLDWNHIYWWSFFDDRSSAYEFGGRHHSCHIPARLSPNVRLTELKGCLLENIIVPYAARDLLSYIRSVKPDFILFLAHCWGIPVVYRVMSQVRTHWHLALHDMPETAGWNKSLGRNRTARFMRYTEEMYRQASSQAVISPAMAEEMRRRTGITCTNIFRCAVEPEILSKLAKPVTKSHDDVIRIGYAGTIIAEATFARLVAALPTVQKRLNRRVEIHLYSWHSYRSRPWFDPTLILEKGPKSEAEIYALYQQLTWGLAIMRLDNEDDGYNRFSFPCKFTTALGAGLPLICIGHRQSALIELAKNYRLGLVITDADGDHLEDRLCEGLADFSRFDDYRAEILRCADKEFNAQMNRTKLHELIRGAQTEAWPLD